MADDVAVTDLLGHGLGGVQQGRLRVQRVEPAARLVDRLADEVGRELAVELVLVLEGVVPLRVGHRPAVEPGVGDLGHALHLAPAGLSVAAQADGVDVGAVEVVEGFGIGAVDGTFGELRP